MACDADHGEAPSRSARFCEAMSVAGRYRWGGGGGGEQGSAGASPPRGAKAPENDHLVSVFAAVHELSRQLQPRAAAPPPPSSPPAGGSRGHADAGGAGLVADGPRTTASSAGRPSTIGRRGTGLEEGEEERGQPEVGWESEGRQGAADISTTQRSMQRPLVELVSPMKKRHFVQVLTTRPRNYKVFM
mmetsp:Transcript_18601/g.51320  ORF Transcript_18601/g.51320 Transcript_18601/m.51320 type:complete len:188 (-) Transcript_18601:73-636(-)